jgi:hypothetical protein
VHACVCVRWAPGRRGGGGGVPWSRPFGATHPTISAFLGRLPDRSYVVRNHESKCVQSRRARIAAAPAPPSCERRVMPETGMVATDIFLLLSIICEPALSAVCCAPGRQDQARG